MVCDPDALKAIAGSGEAKHDFCCSNATPLLVPQTADGSRVKRHQDIQLHIFF
jgi:hypothetical protein